jgi:hypothetical protein
MYLQNQRKTRSAMFRICSIFIIAICILFPSFAGANTGIPGPMMFVLGAQTASFWRWVSAMMFMCVGIEGAIFLYAGLFKHPILVSLIANIASLIAGTPLVFVGALDPTYFVLPTLLSIMVEILVIRFLPASIAIADKNVASFRRMYCWVIAVNVLTNLIMVGYLALIYGFYKDGAYSG